MYHVCFDGRLVKPDGEDGYISTPGVSLVTGPSKRGNKNPKDFLDRGAGITEFKLVGNPL